MIEDVEVFVNNFNLILFNSFLALIPVLFGWLMSKSHSIFAKVWTGFIWLLFLPNTFYILTDISHLFEDWQKIDNLFRFIIIIQYFLFSIIGIATFVFAIYFFQKLLERKSRKTAKPTTIISIIILNFIVGFGVILGGIQRTNSWQIFTDPLRVIQDVFVLLNSQELLILSFGVGLLANAIYFLLAKKTEHWYKKLFKK